MALYKDPQQMYLARAERCQRDGDRHWAQAKNGDGGCHYGKARACYAQAAANREKAATAKGKTW